MKQKQKSDNYASYDDARITANEHPPHDGCNDDAARHLAAFLLATDRDKPRLTTSANTGILLCCLGWA